MRQVDLSRLQSQLLTSGIQQTNNALYQVISQLLAATKQLQDNIDTVGHSSGGGSGSVITQLTQITQLLISGSDSRNDFEGSSILNIGNLNPTSSTPTTGYWEPLTDGDIDETELIFALGDCVMVYHP